MTLLIFSQLVGRPIVDARREKVARLVDLIVRINPEFSTSEETYPPLSGLVAHVARRDVWIPMSQIASFDEERAIGLVSANLSLERFVRRDGEILLGRDVLDKQLVDTQGRRVIRVNDLTLSIPEGSQNPRLVAVDISFRALSRRIFFSLSGDYPKESERLIDWADVQYFGSLVPAVKLHVSHQRLGTFHPAELARVLEDLSHRQRDEVVRALDDETVADTLEELDSGEAADILEEIGDERASDILEAMSPDMAADVVADMQEDKAETLLSLMDTSEAEEVRELLVYPSDSAGGLMTNEFVLLPASLSASEALRSIRMMEGPPGFVDYLYVAEEGTEHMIGVASLRNVVFSADRTLPLSQLMEQDVISVHPLTQAREAAALLTTYGLRALPVVDEEGVLLGIITFDDALDVLLPDNLRERLGPLFAYHHKSVPYE